VPAPNTNFIAVAAGWHHSLAIKADFDGDGIPDEIDTDDDNDEMPDDWEMAHELNPKNASDAFGDADGDGMNNLQEYIAGTNPRDGRSKFSAGGVYPPGNEMVIWFDSISGGCTL
jgi:hypothetical protein